MEKQIIGRDAGLPHSPAVAWRDLVFVSGQVARGENGVMATSGIEAQTRQTMDNVARALALAGCTLDDVVKATVWLDDAREFDAFNRVYGEFFPGARPARTSIRSPRA